MLLLAAWQKSLTTFLISPLSISFGEGKLSVKCNGLGENVCHPPSSFRTSPVPFHGEYVDPFLPACANCIPGMQFCKMIKSVIFLYASACTSLHIPASSGEILPSGDTAVASWITKAAPPTARLPKCTRCQIGRASCRERVEI